MPSSSWKGFYKKIRAYGHGCFGAAVSVFLCGAPCCGAEFGRLLLCAEDDEQIVMGLLTVRCNDVKI